MVLVLCTWFVVLAAPTAAHAGTADTRARWRNCDTLKSAINVRATFSDPVTRYGEGRFMVKKWIKWDYLKTDGEWRAADRHFSETSWVEATNPSWDFISTAGDVTNWGELYWSAWRAHVTIKLIKNRRGPKDKTVETIDLVPGRGLFAEKGSHCGNDFRSQ